MVLKRTGVKRRWMKSSVNERVSAWTLVCRLPEKKEDLRERVFFGEVRIMLGSSVGVLRLYSTC